MIVIGAAKYAYSVRALAAAYVAAIHLHGIVAIFWMIFILLWVSTYIPDQHKKFGFFCLNWFGPAAIAFGAITSNLVLAGIGFWLLALAILRYPINEPPPAAGPPA